MLEWKTTLCEECGVLYKVYVCYLSFWQTFFAENLGSTYIKKMVLKTFEGYLVGIELWVKKYYFLKVHSLENKLFIKLTTYSLTHNGLKNWKIKLYT